MQFINNNFLLTRQLSLPVGRSVDLIFLTRRRISGDARQSSWLGSQKAVGMLCPNPPGAGAGSPSAAGDVGVPRAGTAWGAVAPF